MKKIIFSILFLLLILAVGCDSKEKKIDQAASDAIDAVTGIGYIKTEQKAVRDIATSQAQELCRATLAAGDDLSSGPCLGRVAPDWIADVAHNPRQDVDNLPENQCADFGEGKVHHFVEVDENCNLIREN